MSVTIAFFLILSNKYVSLEVAILLGFLEKKPNKIATSKKLFQT